MLRNKVVFAAMLGMVSWVLCKAVQADTLYINGFWFESTGFQQKNLYVKNGRFSAGQPQTGTTKIVDLQGMYLLPPFAEGHNHNLQNPWLISRFAKKYLADGIFYSLMLGGDPLSAASARKKLAQSGTLDVLISHTTISSSDGHPLRMILQPDENAVVPKAEHVIDRQFIALDSVEDIQLKWPLISKQQPKVVKLMLVHSEDASRRHNASYYGVNGLKPELVKPLVDKLKQQGIRVIAHTESAADFAVAVAAKVDSVAHLPGYHWWPGKTAADYRLSDAVIKQARINQVAVMTTAGVSTLFNMTDEQREKVKNLQKDNLLRLKQQGVRLLAASDRFDANVLSEIFYLDELQLFNKAELLTMLVQTTPQFIFPDRLLGQFKPGYEASFIALKQHPLQQLSALKEVSMRVKQGKHL